jgi:hypothetical protein
MHFSRSEKMIPLKRLGSVLAGFFLIGLLGYLADTVLQQLGILPIPTEHKFETGHALLALTYHLVFAVLGGFVTARLAPDRPLAHAMVLGILGIAISTLGLIAILMQDLAPAWYAGALIVFSIPVTWLGAKLAIRSRRYSKG